MNKDILEILTSKEDKVAYAYTQKIVLESEESNKWYSYFDEFVSLLDHPKLLVRNRVIAILAANAKWDKKDKFNLIINDLLSHIEDEKPITSRKCISALYEIGKAKPKLIKKILKGLTNADTSKYKDSMRPLIEKDIIETINKLKLMEVKQ